MRTRRTHPNLSARPTPPWRRIGQCRLCGRGTIPPILSSWGPNALADAVWTFWADTSMLRRADSTDDAALSTIVSEARLVAPDTDSMPCATFDRSIELSAE